jgi:hypothetical protein
MLDPQFLFKMGPFAYLELVNQSIMFYSLLVNSLIIFSNLILQSQEKMQFSLEAIFIIK